MASRYGKKFDKVYRMLRKECPLASPIRLVTKDLTKEKLCGCCTTYIDDDGHIKKFVIEIDRNMSVLTAIDTLLHEWAHALDYEANGIPHEPHRNSWGELYAKVWRTFCSMPEPISQDFPKM